MDFELSEELSILEQTARDFALKELAPGAIERDATREYPLDIMKKLAPLGFLGIMVPEEYGGAGMSALAYSIIMEEIARWDASVALNMAAQNSLCLGHLMVAANEEQKQKYVAPLASGQKLGAWGLTEPGSGSDAAGMRTHAKMDGDEWVLNGSKMFITQGAVADIIVIMAVTGEGDRKRPISAFILETGRNGTATPGFSARKILNKLGMHASDTAELVLEDVRVPRDCLLGKEGEGFTDTLKVLTSGRIGIGAISVGIARGALEDSVQYAKQREQFGKPIAQFQQIQWMLADMAVQIDAARLLVRRAAAMKDAGATVTREAAEAKLFASETATRASLNAIQILGGYGYTSEFHVERYLRDAKLLEIGEGTSQIQRIVIAKHLMREF
ncbi:MAG: acyl-CoA dehydrogenase [Candidatus Abyssobacteria bacterium SURF_5]|uniref:Cyclohexane-1-carbonyl-CoA dehydrogenase n=1 Tax=Abyssobacteria bacterium (strain SURF_5) TaxID=2093360 RepID=A0A3A4N797_ABYX5|nr:MAG: acyl-CoA dehydrogenase [Candidatus Abyssubacteria bacterium SURF_5]